MTTNLSMPSLLCLCALTAACVIRPGDGGDDVGDTGDTGTGTGETGTSSTDTGTGDTGTDTGTGTGDTGTDTGTGTGDTGTGDTSTDTGPDLCENGGDASFDYAFDFGPIDEWDSNMQLDCIVAGIDNLDGTVLTLECADLPSLATITIHATPGFLLPVIGGEAVHVHHVSEGPWWFNSYLRLDLEGFGHMLTLIDGDSLQPPDNYGFALPFEITANSGLCAWIDGGCGQLERLGLGFTINGEDALMFAGEYAIVGGDPGTEVWVASAGHLHEIQCTDTPDEWFQVLIANTGWE